jgi:hypothetical protein
VLGLGDQVRGNPLRAGGVVRDDQHLRRSRHHIDADPPDHLPFGLRDPAIPRTHDLVDPRNRPGPVGQRTYGLSPSHPEDPGYPGKGAGGEDHISDPLGRYHRDDFLDSRHQGRHRVHHHRGGIRGLPARHVQTDPIQRRDLHPHQAAVGLRQMVPTIALALVVFTDPLDRPGERFSQR